MNRIRLLAIALLPTLLSSCATYESQPVYSTTVSGAYGSTPYYPPRSVYYVEPAPVYVVPPPVYVAPRPIYVAPRPVYGAQNYPQHNHRHERSRDRRGRTSSSHDEHTGNGAGSHMGGPGSGGTVWKR